MITSCTFTLAGELPKDIDLYFGNPNVLKLGYFWFRWGGYSGKLQWINFATQIFFPEAREADGYGWLVFPGVEGVIQPQETYVEGLPAATVGGLLVNPLKGLLPGGPI